MPQMFNVPVTRTRTDVLMLPTEACNASQAERRAAVAVKALVEAGKAEDDFTNLHTEYTGRLA